MRGDRRKLGHFRRRSVPFLAKLSACRLSPNPSQSDFGQSLVIMDNASPASALQSADTLPLGRKDPDKGAGWTGTLWLVALYFAVMAAQLSYFTPGGRTDDSEALFLTQSFELGYEAKTPPLLLVGNPSNSDLRTESRSDLRAPHGPALPDALGQHRPRAAGPAGFGPRTSGRTVAARLPTAAVVLRSAT